MELALSHGVVWIRHVKGASMMRARLAIVCLGVLPLIGAAVEAATPFERGEQAEKELRLDDARDLFRQAVEATPDKPGVAEHTAWFLFLNGFHDEECRDLLRKAAPQSQEPAAMERAARFIERKLGQRGPADEEEQEAERSFHDLMIKRASEGSDEQLGGALVDAGDFEKGIPLLEKAQAADPTNGPLSLRLARAYVWAQQLLLADAAYDKLLERYPDNPSLLLESSQVATGRGNVERAEALIAAAEKARPEDPRIPRERANVAAKVAERAAAARRKPAAAPTEKMAAAPPEKPPEKPEELPKEELPAPKQPPAADTAFARGEKAEKQLRIYEARDLFRQAMRETPDASGVAEHTAWFFFLNGFHDEECLRLLRRAAPKSQQPTAMERAARHVERVLGLRGPADQQEKTAKRAFDQGQIAKAASGTDEQLGGALVDAGDFAEGIPRLERALAADPTNGPLELRLARAYVWAQRSAEADAAYGRLLTQHPCNPAILFERNKVAADRNMLDRARGMLIAAEQARPRDPRILLERSRVEARLVNRRAALDAVSRMYPQDQASTLAILARARAEHYRGQFGPGRDGYACVLNRAPYLEEAAHGLAECRMRRGELGSSDALLGRWMPLERSLDWTSRTDLFAELTDPAIGADYATYSNSLGYFEHDFGLDGSFHPTPETEVRPALVNSIFTQSGFSSIDRQGALVDVNHRPEDWVATHARLGVNGYTNNWVSPVGGLSTEFFPTHWLDIGGGAEYFNLIDFQPPFGIGIYDIVTTIGGVGEKISSTQGSLHVRLRPRAGWTLYGRTRVASFSDGNLFQDNYAEANYDFRPSGPIRTRAGVAYYFLALAEDAPLYQQVPGGPITGAYYSPAALDVISYNLEMSGKPRERLDVGGEGHLYQILENSGFGVGIFLFAKRQLESPLSVLRFDARYFTQNRGLTRQSKSAGSYDALNFVLSYDRRY
jgi:tetratricopeptide (TPR) repeat protein